MSKKKLNKKVWYSSEVDVSGNPILPPLADNPEDLEGLHEGELFLHNSDDYPSIWIRTKSGLIKPLIGGQSNTPSYWEVRELPNGDTFLYTSLPIVTQSGVTMYADGGNLNLPSIVDEGAVKEIIESYGYTTEDWVRDYVLENASGGIESITKQMVIEALGFTPYSAENPNGYITAASIPSALKNPYALTFGSKTYDGSVEQTILASDLGALTSHQTIYTLTFQSGTFASGSFTANSGNKTINIPTTTSHISEGDNLYFTNARAVSALADTLKSYVTLSGTQTISGEKNFTGGLKVNGSPIVYDASKKYWKLEGDLLITGGLTMYGSDSSFTPSTIMDAIAVDGTTISKEGGVLRVIGGGSGSISEITKQMVIDALGFTPISSSDMPTVLPNPHSLKFGSKLYDGSASKTILASDLGITWDDILGRPTLLSSFTDDVVAGKYLPLSGGSMNGDVVWNAGTGNKSILPGHIYRQLFDDTGDVYDHYCTGSVGFNTFANLRVWSNDDKRYKALRFGGDGTFTWDGKTILHSGNYSSYALPLSGGTMTGPIITPGDDSIVIKPAKNNFDQIGGEGIAFYKIHSSYFIGSLKGNCTGSSGSLAFNPSLGVNDSVSTGTISYARLQREDVGVLPFASNANGVLTLNTYGSDYHHQLGFTDYGLFYRKANGVPLSDSIAWHQIAFTDSNVASATKLQTPRTIWGQSFDGTGDVNGILTINSGGYIKAKDGNGYARDILELSSDNTFYLGYGSAGAGGDTYLYGNNIMFRCDTSRTEHMRITSSGNVLIGTTTDSGYKLDVNGTLNATTIYQNGVTLNSLLDDKLNSSSYTASDVLAKLKTVDGSGSGLDADTLDGREGNGYTYHINGSTNVANKYIKIATLPASSESTYDSVTISGTIGGWHSFDKADFKITVGRRDGVTFKGYSYPKNGWDIYVNDNGELLIYLSSLYRAWDLSVTCIQAWFDYKVDYTPTDTNFTKMSDSSYIVWFNNNGSVASATKLQTQRAIWGHSFDGSGNVSGILYYVDGIKGDGNGINIGLHPNRSLLNVAMTFNDCHDDAHLGELVYYSDRLIFGNYKNGIENCGIYYYDDGRISLFGGNVGIGTTTPLDKLHVAGNLRLKNEDSFYGNYIYFGDDRYCYIGETTDNSMTIYASKGIQLNGKVNIASDTTIDGNLLVRGGITMYRTDGNVTPFLIDVQDWELIDSMSVTQVYTAHVTTLLKEKVKAFGEDVAELSESLDSKILIIKTALQNITSSSSVSAIGAALNTLYNSL